MTQSWVPDEREATSDVLALSRLLHRSLNECLLPVDRRAAEELERALEQLAHERVEARLIHPDLFRGYFAFRDAVGAADGAAIDSAVRTLRLLPGLIAESRARARANDEAFGIPVDLAGGGAALPPALGAITKAAAEGLGQDVRVTVVERPSCPDRAATQEAFALLRRYWPEVERETRDFVQRIVFLEGGHTIGASDACYQGAIFLNRSLSRPMRLAEQIVHEAAHTRLNAMLATRKLFSNAPSERFATPMRPDPRPMFGLFHQMFVLARLREYYRRIVGDHPEQRERFDELCGKLEDAACAVQRHAALTPAGSMMVESVVDALGPRKTPFTNSSHSSVPVAVGGDRQGDLAGV